MAITVNKSAKFNSGNKRVVEMDLTTSASSGVVDTGLAYVEYMSLCPKSMATGGVNLKANLGSNTTAVNGRVNINSFATGDDFFLRVVGK